MEPGSLWRPLQKHADSTAKSAQGTACAVVMCPPFRDAQTHPMKVAMTVDTVILATQEKESLLFQP